MSSHWPEATQHVRPHGRWKIWAAESEGLRAVLGVWEPQYGPRHWGCTPTPNRRFFGPSLFRSLWDLRASPSREEDVTLARTPLHCPRHAPPHSKAVTSLCFSAPAEAGGDAEEQAWSGVRSVLGPQGARGGSVGPGSSGSGALLGPQRRGLCGPYRCSPTGRPRQWDPHCLLSRFVGTGVCPGCGLLP